jgi:hypothetical protein
MTWTPRNRRPSDRTTSNCSSIISALAPSRRHVSNSSNSKLAGVRVPLARNFLEVGNDTVNANSAHTT